MTKRSLALISFALLACAAAHAAPKKKHAPAPANAAAAQEVDVDAMARAKDGKPTEPAEKPADATGPASTAGSEGMPTAEAAAAPAAAAAEDVSDKASADTAATPADAAMERPSPLAPPAAPTDIDKSIAAGCESRATSLLDAAQKGDYAGATRDFDAKMRSALPPPKFKQAWESLAQFGALQGRGQAHPMKGDGYIAITIPLIFDKKNLYAQVACGSDGRVAGFYIKPL